LLCYLTQVSRLVGVLEVVSDPYLDESKSIWKDEDFPCRVDVRIEVALSIDTAVPIKKLADQLSIFQDLKKPGRLVWARARVTDEVAGEGRGSHRRGTPEGTGQPGVRSAAAGAAPNTA
jgi:hypothetical protein